jgi:hypothetical protein
MSELGYYAAYDGYNYVDTFPQEWLLCHDENLTGPLHCGNCENYGSVFQNGIHIFIGYCSNCAYYFYMEKKGQGFYGFDNTYLVTHYVYPDYLLKYKNTIIDLVTKQFNFSHIQSQLEHNDLTCLSDHTTEPPSPPSSPSTNKSIPIDNRHDYNDCDCSNSYDVDVHLSEKESEIYSDSDDDLFYV